MNDERKTEFADQIIAEASSWVAQLETGNLSRADIAALREWISRSPAHATEIRAVAQLSGQLSELTDCLQFVEHERRSRAGVRREIRRPRIIGAFAAMAMLAGIFTIYSETFIRHTPEAFAFTTLTGEYETHTLSDGSVVKLNTNSRMTIEYTKDERSVILLFGEAFFDVASDPSRPFSVQAGRSRSEALGTSFSVRLDDDFAALSVLEGVVSFSQNIVSAAAQENESPHSGDIVLNAGQTISIQNDPSPTVTLSASQIQLVPERELMRRLSWREGLIEFSDTPLQEVVEEVNRHIQSPLQIGDDRLSEMRIGGIYRAGDQAAMLEAFERLGIEVDQSDPSSIVLRAGNTAEDTL